jgi:predicted methyltransferase
MTGRLLFLFCLIAISQHSLATAVDEAAVLAAMNKPGRLSNDITRDARSQPQAVIPLLALETGDRVVDIFAGGGYYTELLASVVGIDGEAILHNNGGFEAWGVNGLTDRFAEERDPGNISRHTRSGINLDLGENSLDGVLLVMAFHDLYVVPKRYNGEEYVAVGNPANTGYFLEQILAALKPGGRFVVVDHSGDAAMEHDVIADLHRIEESFTRSEIENAGFNFVDSSDALRNYEDDRSMIVFDLDVQFRTDRFIFAFEKPRI